MKKISYHLLLSIATLFTFSISNAEEDQIVKMANKVTVVKDSDMWLRVTVPFNVLTHPKLAGGSASRPTSVESAYNPEYLDNLKVKVYLCFSNEFKKKLLRSQNLTDAQYYQYYSSEVEFSTVEIDRANKNAYFLFPTLVAERDGFLTGYVNLIGYAVEITSEGSTFEMSNSIFFDKYRDEEILEKFKEQAKANSERNKGVLVPAHTVSMNYLDGTGPVKLTNN